MTITTSWEEKGLEQGRRLELIESTLEVIEHQIAESNDFREQIEQLSNSQLKALRKAAWNMKTLKDLRTWFQQNTANDSQSEQN